MCTLREHANLAVLGVVVLCFTQGLASAQESEDPCLMCHTKPALFQTQEDPDRLVVTPQALAFEYRQMISERLFTKRSF